MKEILAKTGLIALALLGTGTLPSDGTTLSVTNNLDFWVSADTGVTESGGNVSAWADQSGNGRNLTTDAGVPILVTGIAAINNQSAINFTSDRMIATSPHGYNTRIMVVNFSAPASGVPVSMWGGATTAGNQYFGGVGDGNLYLKDPQTYGSAAGVAVGAGNYGILIGTHDQGTIWYNGAVLTPIGSSAGAPIAGTERKMALGYRDTAFSSATPTWDQPFTGNLAEVIVFGRSGGLNAAERVILENSLSAKYDITLNTGGGALDVYAGDTSANGDYDFDVIGIGNQQTVTGSILAGKLSSSFSSGLTLAESASSLGDGDYLLAGHKVANNSLLTLANVAEGRAGQRWDRVWYVDKTGTVDANLTFDFSDGGLAGAETNIASHVLLYSPVNAFSFAPVGVAGTVSGDQISFLLGDGQLADGYYTIATLVPEPGVLLLLGLGAIVLGLQAEGRRPRAEGRTR